MYYTETRKCGQMSYEGLLFDSPDGRVCESCYRGMLDTCENCESVTFGVKTINDMRLCPECGNRAPCELCGESVHIDDSYSAGNYLHLCESCFDDNYIYCHKCNDVVDIDDSHRFDDKHLCGDCFSENYVYCVGCEQAVHIDYSYYSERDGESYCEYCYNPGSEYIAEYEYKPHPNFLGSDNGLYLGVELETACGNDIDYAAQKVHSLSDDRELFYLKEDPTIQPGGFELVTHPASLDYHRAYFGWEQVLAQLDYAGCYDDTSCGLHVHASRDVLSDEDEGKIEFFVHSQEDNMTALARRNSGEWAAFKKKDKVEGKPKAYDRYEAVNFTNDSTIEFRMFASTIDNDVLMGTLELCHAIVRFCQGASVSLIEDAEEAWQAFGAFVRNNDYGYLSNYAQSVGAM